jgi:hypothetical protein
MNNNVRKQINKFIKSCELVLSQYDYEMESVASYECTAICGVILGAAERCDLKDYMEIVPAIAYSNPHAVIRCDNRIIDFTFSQFDETRKWPINTKGKVKGLEILDRKEDTAEDAIKIAESKEIHREIMDKIVIVYNKMIEDKDGD